jgi:hypothetical protein
MDMSGLDLGEIEGIQEAKKKGVVDIIFVIDTSGSMGPAISQIGKNISGFVKNLKPEDVKDWRVRVFSFGDLESDTPDIAMNVNRPWVAKSDDPQAIVDQFVECIENVKKQGGGDEPESSLDAVFLAARDGFDAEWTERTRAIVLFTDASPKKIQKETLGVDADGLMLLSQQITDGHTYLSMFAPTHTDYEAIKNNGGKYVNYVPVNSQGENPVEALKSTDFSDVLTTLGKSVSQASLVS